MYQPAANSYVKPVVTVTNASLKSRDKFCYLGSILSNSATTDDEITQCLAKASSAFGALRHKLWEEHSVSVRTKINVYKALVTTSLLYGCETWTPYIKVLEQFQQRCLRSICNIKW